MSAGGVELQPGTLVSGRYRVIKVLGRGGMGTVYEAEQVEIRRVVAIKVLHTARARKRNALVRFQREARTAAALGLPQVAHVFDAGVLDSGEPYFVMERLEGETLRERLQRVGTTSLLFAIGVMSQVLTGLDALHARGIIHRDVKPENIFLIGDDQDAPTVKLIDFGVAKLLAPLAETSSEEDDGSALTATGIVVGTPWYLAPEQARGARNVDGRSDLFTCGVILYEMLVGKRPQDARMSPPSMLRADLPVELDAVIAKTLRSNRDERYQAAHELHSALQDLLDFCDATEVRPPATLLRAASTTTLTADHHTRPTAEAQIDSIDIPIDVVGEVVGDGIDGPSGTDDEWTIPTIPIAKVPKG